MTDQLAAADLAGMTPGQIEEARLAGRLATLLGTPAETVALLAKARGEGPLTAADVSELYRIREYDLIDGARARGRLNGLLGIYPSATEPNDDTEE